MMTRRHLLRRTLRHFLAGNLTVAAGVAVATAVLTGAMMVGDSVRGSLRAMAVRRLGAITHTVTAPRLFDVSLANRLAHELDEPGLFCEPATVLRGSAATADETARAAGVQILGAAPGLVDVEPGRCIINGLLADALGVATGDVILLRVPRPSQLPANAALSRRERSRQLATMRLTVQRVEREPGFESEFSLTATQRGAPGAWVRLTDLGRAIERPDEANTILLGSPAGSLTDALHAATQLSDYGLRLERVGEDHKALVSTTTYLPAAVEEALPAGAPANRVLVNLASAVRVVSGESEEVIHYAVVAGLSSPPGGPLADDEIALNAWTAEQLPAKLGDRIVLSWYERGDDGAIEEVHSDGPRHNAVFHVARVVPMSGLGADPTLTPVYEGLTDAATVIDWDPPEDLPIDMDLVTDADERYWDRHGPAPKLFVSLSAAQRLWGTPYGRLTSVRVAPEDADAFAADLAERLQPEAMGYQIRPVLAEQLAAARGSTDFAGLYLALSAFLIAAAAMLAALLMRLSVEQRARQIGLLTALGFTPRALRRLALAEGLLVGSVGTVIGLPAALLYTGGIMAGLRTWWFDAVGTTALNLHVEPITLAAGGGAGLLIAAGAVAWGTRRIASTPAAALLAGRWDVRAMAPRRASAQAMLTAVIAASSGAALLALGRAGVLEAKIGALGGGALLMVAALAWLSCGIRPGRRRVTRLAGRCPLSRLAMANAGRRPGRTLLAASLLATTAFLLVMLAAFRTAPPTDTHLPQSGAGGFTLIARPDIPLPVAPTTAAARRMIGMPNAEAEVWDRVDFVAMRRRGGQDASCLNLTRPTDPTILSVPPGAFVDRFTFTRTIEDRAKPWSLLKRDEPDGAVPVITDHATAQWILHLQIGDTLTVTDHQGRPRQLRLVATLAGSMFQSELLMDADRFRRLFPAATGTGVLLAAASPDDTADVRRALATGLADYGAAVETTAALLGRLAEVSNTYLATLQVLGALGLLLGVVGLTVVQLRNLLQRRAELALLTALGLSGRRRLGLLLAESHVALGGGLGAGCAAALIAAAVAAPTDRPISFATILAALACILLVGYGSQALIAAVVGRRVRPADLRQE